MGWFEDLAVFDLKFRLVFGVGWLVLMATTVLAMTMFDLESFGVAVVLGVPFGILAGYLVYRILP